jgi:hypothetical protein
MAQRSGKGVWEMSKKLCPLCRETVYKFPEHNIPNGLYHCGMCEKNFTDEEVLNDDLFHRITASPEVLAPEFVGMMYDRVSGDYRYYSMLTGEFYNNREEAIAAMVARLKEVENG